MNTQAWVPANKTRIYNARIVNKRIATLAFVVRNRRRRHSGSASTGSHRHSTGQIASVSAIFISTRHRFRAVINARTRQKGGTYYRRDPGGQATGVAPSGQTDYRPELPAALHTGAIVIIFPSQNYFKQAVFSHVMIRFYAEKHIKIKENSTKIARSEFLSKIAIRAKKDVATKLFFARLPLAPGTP
jgi:hypothetical protein